MKVVHSKLGDKFYKKKGVVTEVRDVYTAVVEMVETGDKLKIDQAHLETVIPAIGELSFNCLEMCLKSTGISFPSALHQVLFNLVLGIYRVGMT